MLRQSRRLAHMHSAASATRILMVVRLYNISCGEGLLEERRKSLWQLTAVVVAAANPSVKIPTAPARAALRPAGHIFVSFVGQYEQVGVAEIALDVGRAYQ